MKKGKKHHKVHRSQKHKPRAMSKGAFFQTIAERTEMKRKQVAALFEVVSEIVESGLKHRPNNITIPGLVRIKVVHKKATKRRKGINPFTKEPTIFKAKPARDVVKVRAVKALKEMV